MNNGRSSSSCDFPCVMKKKSADIERKKFDTGNPKDEVYVTDLFNLSESPRLIIE